MSSSAMSASPLLRADAEGASVATTADLSAPRSLACELSEGVSFTFLMQIYYIYFGQLDLLISSYKFV